MNQLVIGTEVIPYEERKSVRAKRIIITVFVDKVRVSVPRGATSKKVKEFVNANKQRILEHWLNLQEKQEARTHHSEVPSDIPMQGSIPYLEGTVSYQTYIQKRTHIGLEFSEHSLDIYLPESSSSEKRSHLIREVLIYWYKNEARKVFQAKLAHYAASMGVRYGQVSIKEQKTKWGSCSGKGNINLNWQIIRAPEKVTDYVIIHELAHLKYMNHSPDFWKVVAQEMPEYKVWKKWLREHGRELVF
ncbi:MAG: M48 family metallopeptidase [Desulfitobacteriaceae bacterium]